MNTCKFFIFISFCIVIVYSSTFAASINEEIVRVADRVAQLNLGFGDYVLGKKLSDDQKKTAQLNPIEKSLPGTYKFKDQEIFVVALQENDIVLGIYKEYPQCTVDDLKTIVGNLMFAYGEPTTTAHDKIIYWNHNEKGKISGDVFDMEKSSGVSPLATVKFSSSDKISAERDKEDGESISAYLMITSDPLSKLFLADNR